MSKLVEMSPHVANAVATAPLPAPDSIPVPAPAPPAVTAEEDRYFQLSKPIEVGGRVKQKFDKLLVDVSELPGTVYFELINRYAADFPHQYQTSFTRFRDERFLTLLLVKLNPPMIDEDVKRISFRDLPLLFVRLQSSIFAR